MERTADLPWQPHAAHNAHALHGDGEGVDSTFLVAEVCVTFKLWPENFRGERASIQKIKKPTQINEMQISHVEVICTH